MAEQRLDVAQIGTTAQQMRGAGVAQRVRRQSHTQATARELDARPETDRAEARAGAGDADSSVRRCRCITLPRNQLAPVQVGDRRAGVVVITAAIDHHG